MPALEYLIPQPITSALWQGVWPRDLSAPQKYQRGVVHIAAGGVACSGAAMLAAEAALRIGAGMVTLYAPEAALEVYAVAAPHAVIKRREAECGIVAPLEDVDFVFRCPERLSHPVCLS